jgi:hypothetical protein
LAEENLKLQAGAMACWTLKSPIATGVGLGGEPQAAKNTNATAKMA